MLAGNDSDSENEVPEIYFPPTAFGIFARNNVLRKFAINLVQSKWFERLTIAAIVLNSITLGAINPCDRQCTEWRCRILEMIEHGLYFYFAAEMLIKMMAMSVWGSDSYLDDTWNRFDFVVIVLGLCEYIFADSSVNLSAIRALRVLRPLRAINRLKSLKKLVTLILDILPMLGNVMIFCMFLFFVFGIISVQLWSGLLRQRCYFPRNSTFGHPPDFMPDYYKLADDEFMCSTGFGMRRCEDIAKFEEHASLCLELFATDTSRLETCKIWVNRYTDCRDELDLPGHDSPNFDHMGHAAIAIFQVVSLEEWSQVMYSVQDTFSFWVWTYFIFVVMIGSYFAVKLCLVVIAAQFSIMRMQEKDISRKRRERRARKLGIPVDQLADGGSLQTNRATFHEFIVENLAMCGSIIRRKLFGFKPRILRRLAALMRHPNAHFQLCKRCHSPFYSIKADPIELCGKCELKLFRLNEMAMRRSFIGRIRYSTHQFQVWVKQNIDDTRAQIFFAVLIVVNAIIMASEHYDQSQSHNDFMEASNLIFTIVFSIELLIRVFGLGFANFFREAFNLIDLAVILINIIEIASNNEGFPALSVLRLFRLLRLVKIIRLFPSLQKQLLLMWSTVDNVTTFFLLLGFMVYTAALLGMHMFGCKFCEMPPTNETSHDELNETSNIANPKRTFFGTCRYSVIGFQQSEAKAETTNFSNATLANVTEEEEHHPHCSEVNFDTIFHSLFTVFQVFTSDNWGSVMRDGMKFAGEWASVYFIILVAIGDYIIFNLLIGILVEGFSSEQEKALEEELGKPHADPKTKPSDKKGCCKRFLEAWLNRNENALGCLSPSNPFRLFLLKLTTSKPWDYFFLAVTVVSCLLIALERPGIESHERYCLSLASYAINFVFFVEAFCKILAHGFLFCPNSYLRNTWNIIDFSLLIQALLDMAMDVLPANLRNKTLTHALKPIWLLRALRPLRVISRAQGLKLVLKTLALSIKPIGNIILICWFFFVIFAILGVQLFKGCFAKCVAPRSFTETGLTEHGVNMTEYEMEELLETIKSKHDCLENGLSWEFDAYNFNSLPKALMSLFVFSTLDGWTQITMTGASCTGADMSPESNSNMTSYVFFMSFLLIVCFFALNMFVGVVVNNFQKVNEQMKLEKELAERAKVADQVLNRLAAQILEKGQKRDKFLCFPVDRSEYWRSYPKWRLLLHKLMTHPKFELFVMGAVSVNVLMMALEFYGMPQWLSDTLNISGTVFLGLLTFELLLKLIAFGPVRYLSDKWNFMDALITLTSLIGLAVENLTDSSGSVDPSLIRIARVFRIARIVKLWRAAKNLHLLLDTCGNAIPQVLNLSILFILLFFVYGSLGVQLYGRFNCNFERCDGLSRHANFHHFGMAVLTLFRVFTGDNWNDILKGALKMVNNPELCATSEDGVDDISIPCSVVAAVSPLYFVSFVLLSQFVLINVVVAVLMQQIETLHTKAFEDAIKAQVEKRALRNLVVQVRKVQEPKQGPPPAALKASQRQVIPAERADSFSKSVENFAPLMKAASEPLLAWKPSVDDEQWNRGQGQPDLISDIPQSADSSASFETDSLNNETYQESTSAVTSTLSLNCQPRIHIQPTFSRQRVIKQEFLSPALWHRRPIVQYFGSSTMQISQTSTFATWRMDESIGMRSLGISEKLNECSTAQFEAWDPSWK